MYAGLASAVAVIQASVIRGWVLGPASYIVTAADLHPVYGSNKIFKFAADTYLAVPGDATHTCKDEIVHLQAWAAANNLRLNREKTKEIIFSARRMVPGRRRCTIFSVRRLSRAFSMRRQRGRACARRRTARDSTRCCAAENGSVTVAMTCLPSSTYSTPLTMTFSIASKLTLTTSSSLTFQI